MYRFRLLPLAMVFTLLGCAAVQPQLKVAAPTTGTLILTPQLIPSRLTQTVINPKKASDINRLDIVLYWEDFPNSFSPVMIPAAPPFYMVGDVSLSMASPSIDLNRTISLGNLRHNMKYRAYAKAFDKDDVQISSDNASYVEVELGNDDRPVAGILPIKLLDVPFTATASVKLVNAGGRLFDKIKVRQVMVSSGSEVPIASTSETVLTALHPDTFNLSGLQGNTTYRVKATVEDASHATIATASVDLPVTNDDAPPCATLSLNIPYTVSTLQASVDMPYGVAVDRNGNLFVADWNGVIRRITLAGDSSIFAGQEGVWAHADGQGTTAKFNSPGGLAFDKDGNLFVADHGNQAIRKITPDGTVSTLAGNPGISGSTDGQGAVATFNDPCSVTVDEEGNVYVADGANWAIRKVTPTGTVSTVASNAARLEDGLMYPTGITRDVAGNLYVACTTNHAIFKIPSNGTVVKFAGTPGTAGHADGSQASFKTPFGLAMDLSGNIIVADYGNHTIRKITPAGLVSTLAGTPEVSGTADGRTATFNYPRHVAVDTLGNLWVADKANQAIRKLQ